MKPKTNQSQETLEEFLADDRTDRLIGRPAVIRMEIYAARINGRTHGEIARRHSLSKQAMTRHAKRVSAIYGPPVTE